MMRKLLLLAVALMVVSVPILAQERSERVRFAKGASSKAIHGSIRGYAGVNYIIGARAGQRMTVALNSSNTFNYFNVRAPGHDDAALYDETSGDPYSGTLPETGDYRIQVYLMRNAARRGESADYILTISIE
jgi:hypothetical protein